MDVLKPSTLHSKLAEHLETVLANPTVPGAWRQSRFPAENFDLTQPELEHHGFAIGIPSSSPEPTSRQDLGVIAVSTVVIRWAHRLRADAAVVDTLAAYEAEVELNDAVHRLDGRSIGARLYFQGVTRNTSRSGLLRVIESTWGVSHLYPLARS